MLGDKIRYRGGYKYQLEEDYTVQLKHVRPTEDIKSGYSSVTKNGLLFIKKGYAWDGPSGPGIDTKNSMRGSLIHDALYGLIREGLLPRTARELADKEYHDACEEDGMWQIRRWWQFKSLRGFGTAAAMPSGERPLMVAP